MEIVVFGHTDEADANGSVTIVTHVYVGQCP